MRSGSYLLARFADREQLVPVGEHLTSVEGISHWDAVEGYHHFVIRTGNGSEHIAKELENFDGLSELLVCPVESEQTLAAVDPEMCSSYVYLDADPKQVTPVTESLTKVRGITSVARTTAQCDLIVVLAAPKFDIIDKAIDHSIRTLDGVLRIKQDHVINLAGL